MRVKFKIVLPIVKHLNKIGLLLVIGLFNHSCIEQFDPTLDKSDELVVIDGCIIKNDTTQTITISWSTTFEDQLLFLISGCEVAVSDTIGNSFSFTEDSDSRYRCAIPPEYLNYGMKYQLYVKLPDGREYLSEKEEILKSSEIDSVYYLEESYQNSAEYVENGLQFYTDLSAPDTATKNYMWQVIETFEVQTVYEIDGYWYEKALGVPEFDPVSDSINVCWKTEEISRWYTSSTRNLTVNEKKKIPLNYVSGFDPKLNIRYSILVKQFALSASAYEYHNLNNFMTSEGGLYSVQPPQSKCNIKNIHDPYETVLGYFWAASYTQKRIFYKGPFDNINLSHCNYVRPCIPPEGVSLLDFFRTINGSVFLIALEFDKDKPDSVTLWGYPPEQICIDCTTEGGVTEKPDFW